MINLKVLFHNILHSMQICHTWMYRFSYLLWLYSNKSWFKSSHYQIRFYYPSPINAIDLLVRSNQGSDVFIWSEVFEHCYYDFPLPSKPKTILDLGANAGFTTLFFARKYPESKIASVEPILDNVEILSRNLQLNGVNAHIFKTAIAVEDGQIEMTLSPLDYGHKVANISYGAGLQGETTIVQALSIPTILKQLGWERINLLKIDIEGYEGVLLKKNCDWLNYVDALCIECHEGYGKDDLYELAQKWGFSDPEKFPGTWLLVRLS